LARNMGYMSVTCIVQCIFSMIPHSFTNPFLTMAER
jgi:hypothetical protein